MRAHLELDRIATGGGHRLPHPTDRVHDVARVGTPRDPPAPVASQAVDDAPVHRSADPDGNAAVLQRLRHAMDPLEAELAVVEVSRAIAPQRLADGERAVEQVAALAEIQSRCLVLLALPPHPDT